MTQVSQEYIDGIVEARSFLKANPYTTIDNMRVHFENAKALQASHSGAMKQYFKGQADFWKNQINQNHFLNGEK